uniref:C2 domain-containing protein n=1 Tax=Caenorhabditis tropicalis TaxID=1561998 RepID=A0A1I7UB15_9PELO
MKSHIDEVCDSVSRISTTSRRTGQTEDLADFDDNISSVILDHFLSTTELNFDDSDSADFSLNGTVDEFTEPAPSSSNTATSVQTDLTLLNVEQEIAEYLEHCRDASVNITEEVSQNP